MNYSLSNLKRIPSIILLHRSNAWTSWYSGTVIVELWITVGKLRISKKVECIVFCSWLTIFWSRRHLHGTHTGCCSGRTHHQNSKHQSDKRDGDSTAVHEQPWWLPRLSILLHWPIGQFLNQSAEWNQNRGPAPHFDVRFQWLQPICLVPWPHRSISRWPHR